MLTLLGMFSRASAKLIASFILVIVLMLIGFAYAPGVLNSLSDFANSLEGRIRDPEINEQGKFLFRTLVNENTIFGILMTIIARALVEFIAWVGGSIWRAARGKPVLAD